MSGSDRRPGKGGGAAGSGGYDFQALVGAYVAAHIVARRRLDWFDDHEDIPIAVSSETGGPGDDIQLEFEKGPIEAQVKRGLDRTGLRGVVSQFVPWLEANQAGELLLVVDETSSATIRADLRTDLRRIAEGRRDSLKEITEDVVRSISALGASDPFGVAGRIRIVELPLEAEGSAHEKVALGLLREVFRDDHRRAWSILIREAHRLQKIRGRRDRPGLLALLTSEGIRLVEQAILDEVPGATATQAPLRGETVADAVAPGPKDSWQQRIDDAVKLINAGQASAALQVLQNLEEEAGRSKVSVRTWYRIYTNLAACRVDLQQLAEAEALLLKALDYEESDMTARASLAQVRMAREDKAGAVELARAIVAKAPESITGWSVLIQASDEEISEELIPEAVRLEYQILAARGFSAYRRGDRGDAISFFKQALQRKRDPQVLVSMSQALFAVGLGDDIERYVNEAIEALVKTDHTRLLEEARVLRGVILTRRGDHLGAKREFERARSLRGHSWKSDLAMARNQIALGEPEVALAILRDVREGESQSEVAVLSAFADARLGRADQVRRHLEPLLSAPQDPEDQMDVFLGAAEAALHAGALELATSFLERVDDETSDFRIPLLRARLAAGRGESEQAILAYQRASEMVPESHRKHLKFELAGYLEGIDRHAEAVAAFEQGGLPDAPADVRRDYARALYQAGEASRVLTFLGDEGKGGVSPVWAVELQARVALDREDWPGAIAALEALRARVPKATWVVIKLVEALVHERQGERAQTLLVELLASPEADADILMAGAHLLGQFGHPVAALAAAYRAVRSEPDNPELRLAYLKAFLDAEKNGHPGLKPDTVGPDTWVQLRSQSGESRDYLVLSQPPADIQRSEILAEDDRAEKLLGRRKGEKLAFRVGALDQSEFEVVEIKSAAVRLFQQTLTEFRVWFPDNTNLQSFPVGEGRLDELVPIVSNLQGRANFVEEVLALYEKEILPLGMVATAVGASLRLTYNQRVGHPAGRLFVEAGDQPSIVAAYDAAASGKPIVVTMSSLLTWRSLDLLEVLPLLFATLLVPQSLLDELDRELLELADQDAHGAGMIAWIDDRLVMRDADPQWYAAQRAEIKGVSEWVRVKCQRMPRPLGALTAADEKRREILGGSSQDTIALAKDQEAVIMADDFGLRRLARGDYGIESFSSFAALMLAKDLGKLSEREVNRGVEGLIRLNHDFVQVWPDLIYGVLLDSGFGVTAEVIRVFDRLRGSRADVEPAVRVGISVLRMVALAAVAEGALDTVASLCFESLRADRDDQVYPRIAAEIRRQAALLPLVHDRLIRTLKAVMTAKVLSRRDLI